MYHSETILEFNRIREMLCEGAISELAKQRLMSLTPFLKEQECRLKMAETTQAKRMLEALGTPPLSAMKELEKVLTLCEKGFMLSPEQLEHVVTFLSSCRKMKYYLSKGEPLEIEIASYGYSIFDLSNLASAIKDAVKSGAVIDSASSELHAIRRKLDNLSLQVKSKLDTLLRSKKNIFSDSFVSQRNGRYVLPVKKEFKNQVSGTVVDISATGSTYFIEPTAATKLLDEAASLRVEEDHEVRKILYTLTALVDEAKSEIMLNMEAMVTLDIIFAKGKLSIQMDAIPVSVDCSRELSIVKGRHPLIKKSECVPLDFSIGGNTRGVIITGPNTGGKTVAMKTVGLLSMMAQSGLHIPAQEGHFCMRNRILCDIGDGQSITENLSTFSSHITNIIEILSLANHESIVLLDELGSGTDPAEGMGIAISILEELRAKQCLFIATTHYPEVKEYAAGAEGLINARMAFDRESLKPLYQLEIGEAGESCALSIAKRLGFPCHMLERAQQVAYSTKPTSHMEFNFMTSVAPIDLSNSKPPIPQIQNEEPQKTKVRDSFRYNLGDSVLIGPDNNLGLVFQPADAKGMVGVQVQGKKSFVNHKRLKLKTPASELYPPDYDFSIIFDTVENRKARHQMEKKYTPGLSIYIEKPEQNPPS